MLLLLRVNSVIVPDSIHCSPTNFEVVTPLSVIVVRFPSSATTKVPLYLSVIKRPSRVAET